MGECRKDVRIFVNSQRGPFSVTAIYEWPSLRNAEVVSSRKHNQSVQCSLANRDPNESKDGPTEWSCPGRIASMKLRFFASEP
jgi:hypothetical protein